MNENKMKTQTSSDSTALLPKFFSPIQKFTQKLEYDTYLITSLFIGFILPTLVICLLIWFVSLLGIAISIACFCCLLSKYWRQRIFFPSIKTALKLPLMMFLISIFIIPGLFVVVLQILTIGYLYDYIDYTNPDNNFLFLKLGVILIFLCLICKEISQAYNTFFYIISKISKFCKNISFFDAIFGYISLVMPILQFCTAILLCKISLLVVIQTSSVLDLVQNFAGFYVILEFDNIMFQFIDFLPWKEFFHICYKDIYIFGKTSMHTMANSNGPNNNLIEILLEDIIDFDNKKAIDLETQKTDPIVLNEEKSKDKKEILNNCNLEYQRTETILKKQDQAMEHKQEIVFCYFELFKEKAKFIIISKILLISFLLVYFIVDFFMNIDI